MGHRRRVLGRVDNAGTVLSQLRLVGALPYLDPGSGSMLLQIILGGVAAVGVTAKLTWRRLLRTLRIRRDDDDS